MNIDFFMNVGNWTWSRTMPVIIYLKCLLHQICTKMNVKPTPPHFKFDFSKISDRGGALIKIVNCHRAPWGVGGGGQDPPTPQTPLDYIARRFLSCFEVPSGDSCSIRASPSILRRFASSTRASPKFSGHALRLRLGLRPRFSGFARFSGASRPWFGLRPQLSIGELGLPPE